MATEEQFQTLMSMVSSMTAKLEQLQEDVSSMKEDQKSMKEDQKSMKEDQKKLNGKLEEPQKDQKEIQGSLDLQKKLMKPLYTIKPVPEDVISVLTTDTFRNNVLELYNLRYCIVLSRSLLQQNTSSHGSSGKLQILVASKPLTLETDCRCSKTLS